MQALIITVNLWKEALDVCMTGTEKCRVIFNHFLLVVHRKENVEPVGEDSLRETLSVKDEMEI